MWFVYLLIGVLVLGWAYERARKLGYIDKIKGKSNTKEPTHATPGPLFPCIIEGSVDMPPMKDVELGCRIDLQKAGKWNDGMTVAQEAAICSAPDNGLSGGTGGPFGGRYLTGNFRFTIDANGQIDMSQSNLMIFSPEVKYTVTGGVQGDGVIGMGADHGLLISGRLENGVIVEGRLTHGGGKTWVYGVLNGTYRKV